MPKSFNRVGKKYFLTDFHSTNILKILFREMEEAYLSLIKQQINYEYIWNFEKTN